jgi:peptidoglycan/LPS O-acetylase OafA/YrhL
MILSFVRISIYPLYTQAVSENNFLLASFYSFTIANPYPLLPYLAYGLFGALIGLMIFDKRRDLLKKVILPLGLVFLIFGVAGALNFPKSISKPDYFWYFKTNIELGLFLLLMAGSYLLLNHRKNFLNKLTIIKWFGRISLTVYMLETVISEILRIILHSLNSDFDQTINGCLAFGAINIAVWVIILFIWQKFDFKFSLEYFWVKYFKSIGKDSTKLLDINN